MVKSFEQVGGRLLFVILCYIRSETASWLTEQILGSLDREEQPR